MRAVKSLCSRHTYTRNVFAPFLTSARSRAQALCGARKHERVNSLIRSCFLALLFFLSLSRTDVHTFVDSTTLGVSADVSKRMLFQFAETNSAKVRDT